MAVGAYRRNGRRLPLSDRMKPSKTTSLICIECGATFSTVDVGGHLFFPECMTCFECLDRLRKTSKLISCFGKAELYDPKAPECSRYCQDRLPCAMFAKGEIVKRLDVTDPVRAASLEAIREVQKVEKNFRKTSKLNPFTRGSVIRSIFDRLRESDGMRRGDFEQYIEEMGGDIRYYLRILRKQFRNNVEWKFVESETHYKVELI